MKPSSVTQDTRYGKLTAVYRLPSSKNGHAMWLCLCDCGNTTRVPATHLVRGNIKSCGCLRVKHGQTHSLTYQSWKAMLQRCYQPTDRNYPNYGGRGITVCPEWKSSFIVFRYDMGDRPSKEITLDRINVNGNYEPGNVRWATAKEQANNRRQIEVEEDLPF